MLATFVIGLREGLEAALIVGIIAAFLKQQGVPGALRRMWLGVGLAVALCLVIGIALAVLSHALPQRQQEMLETVIGVVAVAMVTWMVMWMRNHSKDLKRDLGQAVGGALAAGSSLALVAMAFLAVIREGVETAVFLVAASQTAAGATSFTGAGLGIAVAAGLGYALYRGGMKLNLSRFFRITGVVLVLVAGGVLMSSLYHAYEADWVRIGRQTWFDFSGVIVPGSIQESLISGVFGVRAQLRAIDVLAWLLYVIPMLLVVLWPPRRPLPRRVVVSGLTAVGAVSVIGAVVLAWTAPGPSADVPQQTFQLATADPADSADGAAAGSQTASPPVKSVTVQAFPGPNGTPMLRIGWTATDQAGDQVGNQSSGLFDTTDVVPALVGAATVGGRSGITYQVPPSGYGSPDRSMTIAQVAEINGGRVPVGMRAADADTTVQVSVRTDSDVVVTIDRATGLVLSVDATLTENLLVIQDDGKTSSIDAASWALTAAPESIAAAAAVASGRTDAAQRQAFWGDLVPWLLGVWGAIVLLCGLTLLIRGRLRARAMAAAVPTEPEVTVQLT